MKNGNVKSVVVTMISRGIHEHFYSGGLTGEHFINNKAYIVLSN